MKFVPSKHQDLQLAEFDPDDVLSKAVESHTPVLVHFLVGEDSYAVNMAADRYSVLLKSRECACCGVIGNRMFLEPYLDEATGGVFHRMSLYAETRYRSDGEPHFIIMTVDHIIPRREGGPEHFCNYQTLCWLCNIYKDQTGMDISKIQKTLFNACRIYRSSYSVQEARKTHAKIFETIARIEKSIEYLILGIDKAQPAVRTAMLAKIDQKRMEVVRMRDELERILIQSQVSGIITENTLHEV